MNKKTILALSVTGALFTSNIYAATQVADARGNAMGNTGVASSDYLTAGFYNPALVSNYSEDDDFGFFISVGANVSDSEDSLTTIDDLQSFMEEYDEDDVSLDSQDDVEKVDRYLEELDDSKLTVNVDLGIAIAIPTNLVATNLFMRGYTEVMAVVNTEDIDADLDSAQALTEALEAYEDSSIDLLAFGYTEVGLALAKNFDIAGKKVSFGITPKYQQMRTYAKRVSIDDFDEDDYEESEITKNAFNMDLGAAWYINNFIAAVAIKDLFAQEIDAENGSLQDTYNLDTQITLGLGFNSDYFNAAIDADLMKQTRFQGIDDDTQFVRFGVEGDAWGWAQLRAGYEIDLQDTVDNAVTAGLGFSPFGVVIVNVAGTYSSESQLGASFDLGVNF